MAIDVGGLGRGTGLLAAWARVKVLRNRGPFGAGGCQAAADTINQSIDQCHVQGDVIFEDALLFDTQSAAILRHEGLDSVTLFHQEVSVGVGQVAEICSSGRVGAANRVREQKSTR